MDEMQGRSESLGQLDALFQHDVVLAAAGGVGTLLTQLRRPSGETDIDVLNVSDASAAVTTSPHPAALAGSAMHLGSFSKIGAPGLRLGWLIGPADVVKAARRVLYLEK